MKKHIVKGARNNIKLKKKLNWQSITIIAIGIIIVVLMIFYSVRAYHHYIELESHRHYFNQPNAPIQDWMTIRSIVRYYNLSEEKIYSELNVSPGTIVSELGIDNSTVIDRLTIQTICTKKHLDCNAVIIRLNNNITG